MRNALGWVVLLLAGAADAGAQSRVRVTVDYTTTNTVYLSAGEKQGLFAADTVSAHQDTLGGRGYRLVILSSSRARSVATVADSTFQPKRGDILFVSIGAAALRRMQAAADSATVRIKAADQPAAPATSMAARRNEGVRASGRIGLEASGIYTSSRYGTGESQTSDRTWVTPTARLRLRLDDLPGGMRFSTNMRATYLSGSTARPDATIVQVYQASLEADIRPANLHVQIGRFYNSYESHSGYWDGVLMRVGGQGMGAGVILGYSPTYANQGWSSGSPKFSAFMDAHTRSGKWRYDVDISAHQQSNVFLLGEQREFLGFSQSIGYGRTWLTQRVQVGRTAGQLELWQAQLTGSAAIAGPLSVNARYTTERNDLFMHNTAALGRRTRWSAGAVLAGRAGFASVDAGRIDSGDGVSASSASGNFFLPRLFSVAGFGFSGSMTREADFTSTYLAPFVERTRGRFRVRAGGTYYRTDFGGTAFEQKGGEFALTLPVGARTELGINASAADGSNIRSGRTTITFWQSF